MKQVLLNNSEEKVLIDNKTFKEISNYDWRLSTRGYPRATINGKRYYLHQYILRNEFNKKENKNKVTDHINRNRLDNRKKNLRICTSSQNSINISKIKGCVSKYKGVRYDKSKNRIKRWMAACEYNYKGITIGRFHTQEEAALAYNKKAKELWGKFAYLNKIKGEENGI